ncbi:hypothetical protein Q31b_21960 [Novipirellula aureliae]|uniref:Uncharacterized protein n=1 Tax=Novipirellula aureliae TaxID=2527966 RepID=A0A5C6E2S1_9BACT|nr:hypothetical protein [Novipirellula aureliae]TWU43158.1 hypothetical protein Q31b_21960 [Novipirellula aureliae]
MRKTRFAACTFLLVFAVAGCRQTSSSTAGSPLTPIGPLAPVGLSPIGASSANASAAMGSLSAPTRVPPPPSNSANTQAGAFVPYGQTSSIGPASSSNGFNSQPFAGNSSASGFAGSQTPIGSGIATVGWTETNTNSPTSNASNLNQSVASGLRFNGMQVNDLTGSATATLPTYSPPMQAVQPTVSQGYNAPVPAVEMAPNPNFQAAQRFEQPPTSTLPGPSTEPVGDAPSMGDDNLPWRRPGTTY